MTVKLQLYKEKACNFTNNELRHGYFLRILSTFKNTYFKEYLSIAASETWLCKKELVIDFTEEFLSMKSYPSTGVPRKWYPENLEEIFGN